jgi:hypothetical protein
VGVGKRPRTLAIFREQRGGFAKLPGGGVFASGGGRARAARRVSRETRRGRETGHLLRTLILLLASPHGSTTKVTSQVL